MEIVQERMQQIIPPSVHRSTSTGIRRCARDEAGRVFEERNSALYYMFANGDVENLSEGSTERKEVNERVKWIAYKNQFFTSLIVPDSYFTTAIVDSEKLDDNPDYIKEIGHTGHTRILFGTALSGRIHILLRTQPLSAPLRPAE